MKRFLTTQIIKYALSKMKFWNSEWPNCGKELQRALDRSPDRWEELQRALDQSPV